MDGGNDKTTSNKGDSNIISLDGSRTQNNEEIHSDGQQPFEFDGVQDQYSFDTDENTQDLLRALQQGEIPYNDFDDHEYELGLHTDQQEQEIPVTAAERSAEIQEMVEAMAGDADGFPEDDEDDKEDLTEEASPDQSTVMPDELPNMEIKSDDERLSVDSKVAETQAEKPNDSLDKENANPIEAASDRIPWNDSNDDSEVEEKRRRELNDDLDLQGQNQQQPPMAQTNLAGGLGHAFGSVITGVFSGIGMALGATLSGIKSTKEAFGAGANDTSISNKLEAAAHFHFSPASQAVNDTFNEEEANDWKQNRIDTEFASLQMDVDAHLRAVDKFKQTEWAKKLKSIEESGDPELMAKAPAILNMEKSKIDFKDADRDMSYFQEHIQQRAERLSSMINDSQLGSERLENVMNKWQEEAKKRLDDLPDAKEKQGILDRIQNSAHNIMAGLRSMFSKSNSIG